MMFPHWNSVAKIGEPIKERDLLIRFDDRNGCYVASAAVGPDKLGYEVSGTGPTRHLALRDFNIKLYRKDRVLKQRAKKPRRWLFAS